MAKIAVFLISVYRSVVSPALYVLFGGACKYKVSCSKYAQDSFKKYGFLEAINRSTKRFLSCNNF